MNNDHQYRNALMTCAIRYRIMYPSGDSLGTFIDELIENISHHPIPKLCRWLGYIQGVLIERNFTTVEAERDWTRPLFRPLDFNND